MATTDITPTVQSIVNRFLRGTYALRIDGFLRAKDEQGGVFVNAARPQLSQAAFILAGQPDQTKPDKTLENGCYPYAVVGYFTFDGAGALSGKAQISIGGNSSGNLHNIQGTYQVNVATTFDGTIDIRDLNNNELLSYYFVAGRAFDELDLIDITAKDFNRTRTATASGALKRAAD